MVDCSFEAAVWTRAEGFFCSAAPSFLPYHAQTTLTQPGVGGETLEFRSMVTFLLHRSQGDKQARPGVRSFIQHKIDQSKWFMESIYVWYLG